jgi:hypothetical protein
MRTYVVDFDDFADVTAPRLDTLARLKDKTPNLRVTLFTIPRRTSDATLKRAYDLGGWIYLAPHGWRHTRGECLGWSKDEAVAKIIAAKEQGIDAPCFRAPAWLIDPDTYDACLELDYVVCDHKDFNEPGHLAKVYRYNGPAFRRSKVTPVHGHLTNCMDNYIETMVADSRLSFANNAVFLTPWEAAK